MIQLALQSTGIISVGFPDRDAVGLVVFQIVGTSWSGSAVVKIRVGGALLSGSSISNANLKTCAYSNWATSTDVAAGVPVTADGIYAVVAPGVEVVLDYTHTSGLARVYANLLILGSSAGSGGVTPPPPVGGGGFFGQFFGQYFGEYFG